ncbi:coiled-coil domain-containing protein 102B [Ctenodactylus gundi]
MNLDSIHRLIEEAQILQMQQSSSRPHCDMVAPSFFPENTSSCPLPHCGTLPRAGHSSGAHSLAKNSWDVHEELRLQEFKEVKARAAQMEKTMRWWSDCTANWRDKWSKVRAERNSAREEGRQLRIKLEMTMKELSVLKKKCLSLQKESTEANVTQELELPSVVGVSYDYKDQLQTKSQVWEHPRECFFKRKFSIEENTNTKECVIIDSLKLNEKMKLSPDSTVVFQCGSSIDCTGVPELRVQEVPVPVDEEGAQISVLQLRVLSATPERQENLTSTENRREKPEIVAVMHPSIMREALEKEVARLESAVSLWKWKYEKLKESKTPSWKEFDILYDQHEKRTGGIIGDRIEEYKLQNNDKVICELRAELERLRAESALEWDKRELLEAEKRGLERENRRLKAQMKEVEKLLDRKHPRGAASRRPDCQTSQMEFGEMRQAWCSWRHVFSYCVLPPRA